MKWYAMMLDKDDNDWGYGSFDYAPVLERAKLLKEDYPDCYIAVIEGQECVKEIHIE